MVNCINAVIVVKSINIAAAQHPLSIKFSICSVNSISATSVQKLGWAPNCGGVRLNFSRYFTSRSAKRFSISLLKNGRIAIGRELPNAFRSPFLNTGTSVPCLSSEGKIPGVNLLFMRVAIAHG